MYKPYSDPEELNYRRSSSGYPGLGLDEARKERIRTLDLAPDEVTVDDIVWSVSRNASSYFFLFLREVAKQHGDPAAQKLARRFGYVTGRSNYKKMQKKYGVTTLTPEMIALYEDTVHLLGGVEMAGCVSEFDRTRWTGHRTVCPFHSGAPDGAGNFCRSVTEGFSEAYKECDPGIEEMRYDASLMDGDDHCTHVIVYTDTESS